jgi:hypothetical protein
MFDRLGSRRHLDLQHRAREAVGDFLSHPAGRELSVVQSELCRLLDVEVAMLDDPSLPPEVVDTFTVCHAELRAALDRLMLARPGTPQLTHLGQVLRQRLVRHIEASNEIARRRPVTRAAEAVG